MAIEIKVFLENRGKTDHKFKVSLDYSRALTLPNEDIVKIYMRHLQNRGVERVKLTDIFETFRIIPGTLFVG